MCNIITATFERFQCRHMPLGSILDLRSIAGEAWNTVSNDPYRRKRTHGCLSDSSVGGTRTRRGRRQPRPVQETPAPLGLDVRGTGRSRPDTLVEQRELEQWFLRITQYAD